MGFLKKLFGNNNPPEDSIPQVDIQPDDQEPFMEHPTGEFDTSLQAITSAMQRLDRIDMKERWITFSGQGQGSSTDSYQIEDVKFRNKTFDLTEQTVDLPAIMASIGLDQANINVEICPEGKITLPDATPEQLARFLDALFQKHFAIKPFEGEQDYAVGAEWSI